MPLRTLAEIDAELDKLRGAKEDIVAKLRALVPERDAVLIAAQAQQAIARLSPAQRTALAQEISGVGGIAPPKP